MIDQINSVGWANLLTTVMLIVTGGYVGLTWRIANANQKMLERVEEHHKEEVRPNVYAYLEFRGGVIVRLSIENKGRTPAYDVSANLSDDFYQFAQGEKNIRDFSIFNEVISWFPPAAKISIDLAQGFNFDVIKDGVNITPSKFIVSINYKSKFDSYSEKCIIDFTPYGSMHVVPSVAEQLGKIESQLSKLR